MILKFLCSLIVELVRLLTMLTVCFLYLYVKDVIDYVDGYDGIVFNRWYVNMCRKGVQVDWYDCR